MNLSKQLGNNFHCAYRSVLTVLGLLTVVASSVYADGLGEESHWYDPVWPLGDKVPVVVPSETYIPFKSISEIPARPALAIELGDAFLGTGNLYEGFEVPLIGAVWQPRFWAYGILRTAIQTYDNDVVPSKVPSPGSRATEWASRLDAYFNLQLTGTEKIVLGIRPLDRNELTDFSRYSISGAGDSGFKDEFNLNVETLYFEGDLGSLFPNLDRRGVIPLDLGFTVGRQPITFQEGILINDTVDALGFVRNNIPFWGTSNLRISALWSWNRLDRNDAGVAGTNPKMYGLFTAIDAHVSTFNLDLIYVDDRSNIGDGFYIGASAIQRIKALGGLSTAFRVNASIPVSQDRPRVIDNGVLISGEFSFPPVGSDDIAYFNPFVSVGNFTQAGRERILGGPLASLGILFASANLGDYFSEINGFTDDVTGFALGYQAFWDHKRRNLILEIAGRHEYDDDNSGTARNSIAIGYQLQQALGRYFQVQLESFYTLNSRGKPGSGGRLELLVVY